MLDGISRKFRKRGEVESSTRHYLIFKKRFFNVDVKHSKQLKSIVLSYLAIIVSVTAISLISHVIIAAITKSEIYKANERLVVQMKTICDDYMDNALRAANKLVNMPYVNKLASNSDISSEEKTSLIKNIMNEEQVIRSSNKIISDVCVLLNANDVCITVEMACDREILYQAAFSEYFKSNEEMAEMFFESGPREFKVLQSGSGQKFLILYSFRLGSSFNEKIHPIVVAIELDVSQVINNHSKNMQGNFLLVTDKSDVLLSDGIDVDYLEYIKNDVSEFKYIDNSYMINYIRSNIFGGYYVNIIDKSSYARLIVIINWIILIFFVINLIIGMLMSFKLAKRDYIFVSKLLGKIEMDEDDIKKKDDGILNMYLSGILTGREECMALDFKKYLPDFKYGSYAVILFNIEEFGIDNEKHSLALFNISNVFSELINDMAVGYYCEMDGLYVSLVNFDASICERENLCEKVQYMSDFLSKHLGIIFAYKVSEITDDYESVHDLYSRTRNEMSRDFIFNDEIAVDSGELAELNSADDRCLKIMEFVQENYSDANLSVKEIADHFGLSFNYISKYFKVHTGTGLAKYIIYTRIEKSKELLANTDKLISQIADEVGFYSSNVFIRTFKKIEEITPGKYREENRK